MIRFVVTGQFEPAHALRTAAEYEAIYGSGSATQVGVRAAVEALISSDHLSFELHFEEVPER